MNQLIIFCAAYLIYISLAYVLYRIYNKGTKIHAIRNIVIIIGSAVVAWVVGHFLKGIIMHPRPNLPNTLITPDDIYSFPSGHATFMFALAYAAYSFDKHAGKIAFILGVLTGVARVLAGVHFWYDIVGGFVLGCVVAFITLTVIKRFTR